MTASRFKDGREREKPRPMLPRQQYKSSHTQTNDNRPNGNISTAARRGGHGRLPSVRLHLANKGEHLASERYAARSVVQPEPSVSGQRSPPLAKVSAGQRSRVSSAYRRLPRTGDVSLSTPRQPFPLRLCPTFTNDHRCASTRKDCHADVGRGVQRIP